MRQRHSNKKKGGGEEQRPQRPAKSPWGPPVTKEGEDEKEPVDGVTGGFPIELPTLKPRRMRISSVASRVMGLRMTAEKRVPRSDSTESSGMTATTVMRKSVKRETGGISDTSGIDETLVTNKENKRTKRKANVLGVSKLGPATDLR